MDSCSENNKTANKIRQRRSWAGAHPHKGAAAMTVGSCSNVERNERSAQKWILRLFNIVCNICHCSNASRCCNGNNKNSVHSTFIHTCHSAPFISFYIIFFGLLVADLATATLACLFSFLSFALLAFFLLIWAMLAVAVKVQVLAEADWAAEILNVVSAKMQETRCTAHNTSLVLGPSAARWPQRSGGEWMCG